MVFKKSIFISLLSHVAVFSLFSLSFGNKITPIGYTHVAFLGQLLNHSQVNPPAAVLKNNFNLDKTGIKTIFARNPDRMVLEEISEDSPYSYNYYLKPSMDLGLDNEKELFIAKTIVLAPPLPKREQTVILHPLLPYSFGLYFKDRQVAHVELMFQIIPAGNRNSILVKRKISSGNLEVDLLSMRYIGHYLFIQQNSFIPNNWQVAKIDLSEKEQ
jgi:hypothetical protein